MKIYEYGIENEKSMLMFQCSAEPSWIFFPVAEEMAKDFHVFFAAADGHNPEEKSTFESVEKYVDDAVTYVRSRGIECLDLAYGVSMGGSAVMRLLAVKAIPVKKAIIDAGITPYPYPLLVRKLIALKDLITISIGVKNMSIAKKIAPPERWTPEGEDPDEFYKKLFSFLSTKDFSSKTIYNVFWSANNWHCPVEVCDTDADIEYWYGEEEKGARKENIAWAKKTFPGLKTVEHKGFQHAELVMVHPKLFHEKVLRFMSE